MVVRMNVDLPDFVASGDCARLFPVLSETNKERRITSIVLAVLTQIPSFAEAALKSVGVRVGKRTRISAYTEVVLKGKTQGENRPDGLLVVSTGPRTWTALVETKIGRNQLDDDQVCRYVNLARENGIDAVITISNQFVARADISPASVPKTLLRKTGLYHWSWPWLTTQCEILYLQKAVDDPEQAFLLEQLLDFLRHPSTGVERFTMMGPNWKSVVQDVTNRSVLKKNAPEVREAVESWFEETRDLSLHISTDIGVQVSQKIPRGLVSDPNKRLASGIQDFVKDQALKATYQVPDAAADIDVCADLATRTISVSMKIKAPADKKSTKARVNWLLRMIKADDERLLLRAHWPGRIQPTDCEICKLREDPDAIQAENPAVSPHTFEVILVERNGKRFIGRKTFIEDLERLVPEFYNLVGSKLRAWQPIPPKPVQKEERVETGSDTEEPKNEREGEDMNDPR